jgi:nicotinate-nucleotide--dimethylbenzimidazole phosphoribosyltransferase
VLVRAGGDGNLVRMSDRSLDLDDFGDLIERPNARVRRSAEERRSRIALPPKALGRLDEIAAWLAAAQGRVPVAPVAQPKAVLFAGDHGIAGHGVSARPALHLNASRTALSWDRSKRLAVHQKGLQLPFLVTVLPER